MRCPFSYAASSVHRFWFTDLQQTNSAARVTEWFVTMTGRMFAWLFVMDEKRKMAEGSERKNIVVAAKK
jgi:hypothetical protein